MIQRKAPLVRRKACPLTLSIMASAIALCAAFPASAQVTPERDLEAVDDIVVTGTRTERTRRDAPVRTDVVGQQVLKSAAPRNLADALDYLPGARAESNCQNCNTTEIQLLGLPGAYNQILFNGLPMMSGVAAVYGVEQIPAALIERIEVVKGGASALYGPGAVAGVVNVIPFQQTRSNMRAVFSSEWPDGEHAWSATIVGSHVSDDASRVLSGYVQYDDSPWVDYNGDGYSELAERNQLIAGLRGNVNLAAATRLDFDYQYTDEERRGGDLFDRPPHLSHSTEALDSRIHRGALTLEHQIDEATWLTGVYSVSVVDRDSYYGGLGDVEVDPAAPGFDQTALDDAIAVSRNMYGDTRDVLNFLEARLETTRGAHAMIGGVQYRHEKIRDRNLDVDGLLLNTLADDSFDNLGVFIQDEWTLNEGLRAILGLRADKASVLDDPVFSPRIGLWWSPTTELVWRANLSTGFRAPELFSEDLHVNTLGADPIRVRDSAGLTEEKATSFSLGFDYRPLWNEAAVTLDAQAYATRLKDAFILSEIRSDAGGLYQERSNGGDSWVFGAELNTTWRVNSQLQLIGGLAWTQARFDDAQTLFDDEAGLVIESRDYLKSPTWSAVGQALWMINDHWDAYLAVRHVGRMQALNNNTASLNETPTFFVADLSLTRHFHGLNDRNLDLSFGVKNLTDDRQKDLEVGANRDSDYVYGPRSPRTAFIRLDASF